MLKVDFDIEALAPLLTEIARATIAEVQAQEAKLGKKLAYSEPEAAAMLDLEPHQLRDARRRGVIAASVITGRRVRYLRQDLLDYMARCRVEAK